MIRVIREVNKHFITTQIDKKQTNGTYKLNRASEVLWSDDGNGYNLYKVVITCSEQLQVPLLYVDLSLVIDSEACNKLRRTCK